MRNRCIRSLAILVTVAVLSGIGLAEPAYPNDDPLLFLVAAPNLQLAALPTGAVAVALTVGETSIPDGFPTLRGVRFDPQAVVLRFRRIDGILRPWQRLTTSASASDLAADADIKSYSFGAIKTEHGATYELSLTYADALSWLPTGPSPQPSEYFGVLNIWNMGAKICHDTSVAATIAAAHTNVTVITVPSQPVATPDIGLRTVRRLFAGRTARVIRGAPVVFSGYGSPHACDYSTPLKPGERVTIASVDRDAASSGPAVTSVGPLGVAAAAAIPEHSPRMVFEAIRLELTKVPFKGDAQTRELIFASPEELREYLAPD